MGEAKFAVSKALRALQKDGLIGRERMLLGDNEVVLYYRRYNAMSGFHRFMEREVTKKLEAQGITYELAKPGNETSNYKHSCNLDRCIGGTWLTEVNNFTT